ncbi:Kelch repeat-containing protein [Polyangium jinanense]|uniref:Uncharacterized protein n=2 Tax=Polyangium jinanense TaxID=2829994 RepID=A0A9X3X7X2_9BACT|nr:kelch repeat-containing protein [Polyangium jinanense]MDC3983853.1 hypothetical protein [Polyangium jinanense]
MQNRIAVFLCAIAGIAGGAACRPDTSTPSESISNDTGGRGGRAGAGATELRARFPQKAPAILDVGESFLPVENGFASPSPLSRTSGRRGLMMSLPAAATRAVVLHTPDGFEIRVRERGIVGPGAPENLAVVYPREGGSSFWTAVEAGYEEWLLLDEHATAGDGPVATWDVEGAALRQDGDAVEVLDAAGGTRVRVTAPAAWAEDGRPVDVKLVAREATIELFADIEGESLLVDPLWTSPPAMTTPRWNHAAALLQDGRVLITGGATTGNWDLPTAVVDIYDVATNTITAAAPMTVPRNYHTATVLSDGRVLVAGGLTTNGVSLQSCEIYDPTMNTWSSAAAMNVRHRRHAADILSNGQVVVVGG